MSTETHRYLLDTNILSDLIKNPAGKVAEALAAVGPENVCTSIVVACELRFGARKKNAPVLTARIERLLDAIEVIPFDASADRVYAEIRVALETQGRPSSANDLLIAAHAVLHECVLVTDNISEFERVPDLLVRNWLAS